MNSHDAAHSVCSECNQTNFDQILNSVGDINSRYGITVAQLGNRLKRGKQANCYICQFFSALRLPAKVLSEYHLRALSAYRTHSDFNSARIPRSLSGKGNVFVVLPGKEHYRGSWDSVFEHWQCSALIKPRSRTRWKSVKPRLSLLIGMEIPEKNTPVGPTSSPATRTLSFDLDSEPILNALSHSQAVGASSSTLLISPGFGMTAM